MSEESPTVCGINIYPIKACHYITVEECEVDNLGIKYDRRFMIIDDAQNRFISQRKFASFAIIQPHIDQENNTFTISADGLEPLVLPLQPDFKNLKQRTGVKLWKNELNVYDMGDEAAAWFTEFLKKHEPNAEEISTRLVTLEDPNEGFYNRPAHPKLPGIHASFSDWSPISFGFVSSLDDLNKGLKETGISKGNDIPINRFRNNITIQGTIAWEEDQWLVAKVGEVTCYIVQPIARCSVPSINQDTGIRDDWDGKEPTDYLRLRRQFRDKPGEGFFCVDVVPLTSGKIRVGDQIQVLERIPDNYQQRPLPPSA